MGEATGRKVGWEKCGKTGGGEKGGGKRWGNGGKGVSMAHKMVEQGQSLHVRAPREHASRKRTRGSMSQRSVPQRSVP
eukprot:363301-Chlamydomonas_euryale.AAC.2